MADQTADPATGAEQAAVPTDQASAIAKIQSMMHPDEGASEDAVEAPPQADPKPEPVEEEPPVVDDEDASQDGESSEPADEAEAPEDDTSQDDEGEREFPRTLADLAAAYGKEPIDIASEFVVELKGPNGEVRETVSLAEAIDGYMMKSDYTQKTMDLAEQRRTYDGERTAAAEHWTQKFQDLDTALAMAGELLSEGPSEADLYALADQNSPHYDPAAYVAEKSKRDQRQAKLQALQQKHQQARQQQAMEAENRKIQFRTEQQRLLSQRMPEMRNDTTRRQFEADILEGLPAYGFTRDQVAEFMSGPFDHRQVLLAADAIKYRKLQKGTKALTKQVKTAPRKMKPGTPSDTRNSGEAKISQSRNALRKTGRKEDAVAHIRNIL